MQQLLSMTNAVERNSDFGIAPREIRENTLERFRLKAATD
jgi:hypothetical protein